MLHLVTRITDTVFSFLGPATTALADQGVVQTIVLVDDPRDRHLLARFHPAVQLVLINARLPFRQRHAALLAAYGHAVRVSQPTAAHLHGVVCFMLGVYASRTQGLSVPTFFTPHGSRTLAPLRMLWRFLRWAMRPVSARFGDRLIASSGAEARQMRSRTSDAVHLVESPVDSAFLNDAHAPGPAPHVMAGDRDTNTVGAALFAQCAVLLVDLVPDLRFSWIGTADSDATDRMKAAGITLMDLNDDGVRARHMATAWIFLAPEGTRGFPVFLAQAMALGLPCVAWNRPNQCDLIEHGATGFLCQDCDEALEYLAQLLESAPLRKRIGEAARSFARQRFDNDKFRAALLDSYGMPAAQ